MSITLKTQALKEMVSKANACASYSKTQPITNLMCIKAHKKDVTIITTDKANYLYVSGKAVKNDEEDFYAVIYAEQFMKLAPKITSEEVTLDLTENAFVVTGNGKYSIGIPLENGEMVEYPNPLKDVKFKKDGFISADTVKSIIRTVKPSIPVKTERPVLTNYYVAGSVIGSDGCMIAELNEAIFNGKPVLLSSRLVDLLSLLEGEISYTITKKCIVFSDENSILYGDFTSDIADYYVKETVDFLASEFSYSAKLNKEKLLSAIDRVMIFIDGGDKRALSLEFSPGELSITTVRAGSVETVECTESPQATFNCYINADMFIEQLKAYEGEVVTIMFGLDYAIELSGTNTKQIISLMSV